MIRLPEPRVIADITRIYNADVAQTTVTFETEPVSEVVMAERINTYSPHFPFFVYECDGEVTGYCYVHPWKARAAYRFTLETTVYLAPGQQGKGIGVKLMSRLIEACRAGGYHALIACITAENESSMRFHERLGFRQVSLYKEVGQKFGRWLDVADMELLLTDKSSL